MAILAIACPKCRELKADYVRLDEVLGFYGDCGLYYVASACPDLRSLSLQHCGVSEPPSSLLHSFIHAHVHARAAQPTVPTAPLPVQLVGDESVVRLSSQCRRLETLRLADTAITKLGVRAVSNPCSQFK